MLIVDTATTLLGSKELACRLPIIEYLSEKMCGLCYERAWYAKLGGCVAIKFMFEKVNLSFFFNCTKFKSYILISVRIKVGLRTYVYIFESVTFCDDGLDW